jgi:hypothetical protein
MEYWLILGEIFRLVVDRQQDEEGWSVSPLYRYRVLRLICPCDPSWPIPVGENDNYPSDWWVS